MTDMALPHLDVNVEAGDWHDIDRFTSLSRKAVDSTCALAELKMHPETEMGILLTDDANIKLLNQEHRGKASPTNVLSFPICDADTQTKGPLLGDVVLAFETLEAEAQTQKKSLDEHFSHLIIHGILHLFGYDHQIEDDANEMEALEISVMRHLGYPDPYAGAV